MARKPRIKYPNHIYSVVTRVNNSKFSFANEQACIDFLEHLKEQKKTLGFKLYAFVIMSSHVHLLIQTNDEIADISKVMCHINGKFAVKYNKTNQRKGHFWMDRFKSKLVEDIKHVANTIVYFALNPVRAGITDHPLKFKFSSVHNAVDQEKFGDILDPLPQEYAEIVTNFLKKQDFMEYVENIVSKIQRIYSFDLKKSTKDQQFRNFSGSISFIKKLKTKTK